MFKIATDKLLLVAGIVWILAGANIAHIGLTAYWHDWGLLVWVLIAATGLIFALFHVLIFQKMVGKHSQRIRTYEQRKTSVVKFFDRKGYVMMLVMMGGGMALRASGVVPDWFIAFFYTGLGIALLIAGTSFILRYIKSKQKSVS